MPVHGVGEWIGPDARSDGSGLVAAGRIAWGPGPVRFDRHHHDHDELWLLSQGSAVVLIDGEEREGTWRTYAPWVAAPLASTTRR